MTTAAGSNADNSDTPHLAFGVTSGVSHFGQEGLTNFFVDVTPVSVLGPVHVLFRIDFLKKGIITLMACGSNNLLRVVPALVILYILVVISCPQLDCKRVADPSRRF